MRLAVVFVVALVACGPRPAPPPSGPGAPVGVPAPGVVSAAIAARLIADGARVVDVRTPQEFAAGHVPGAINIPFEEVGRRAAEVGDPAEPVVLYCRTGRRSGVAAETLRRLGFGKVYDFQRFSDWPASTQ